jgi:hypothetical protein
VRGGASTARREGHRECRGCWQRQQHPRVAAECCQPGNRPDHCFSLWVAWGTGPVPVPPPCARRQAGDPAITPTMPPQRSRGIAASTQPHTWPAGIPDPPPAATSRSGPLGSVRCCPAAAHSLLPVGQPPHAAAVRLPPGCLPPVARTRRELSSAAASGGYRAAARVRCRG